VRMRPIGRSSSSRSSSAGGEVGEGAGEVMRQAPSGSIRWIRSAPDVRAV
jgi:hypothetical protein